MDTMADPAGGYAAPSLAPGPSPSRQSERRQMTMINTGRIRQRGRPAPIPNPTAQAPQRQPTQPMEHINVPTARLDTTYSQLG